MGGADQYGYLLKLHLQMDPVVLSFHDSSLRESDVSLLEGSNWLNDRIIGFYFE